MLQGRLRVRRRGDGRLQHHDAVPGTVWLCPAGIREDMIHLYGDVEESIHLYLPASPLSETALREFDVDPDKVRLRYDGGFRDPLVEYIAREIHAEMMDEAPLGTMQVETLARALGVYIMRHYSNLDQASTSLPAVRGALDARRLERVMEFIDAHISEDLTIDSLADEVYLSPFHFARAFKAATGSAPHRNIQWDAASRAGTSPRLGCRFLLRACRVSLDYAARLGIAATSRTTGLAPGSGPARLLPLLERQSINGPHYRAPTVDHLTAHGQGRHCSTTPDLDAWTQSRWPHEKRSVSPRFAMGRFSPRASREFDSPSEMHHRSRSPSTKGCELDFRRTLNLPLPPANRHNDRTRTTYTPLDPQAFISCCPSTAPLIQ